MVVDRQAGTGGRPRRGKNEPVWKLVLVVLAMAGSAVYQFRQPRMFLQQIHMKIEQHFREPNFRKPTPTEAEVIERLLAADFPGKDEIAKQLAGCRVRIIDDEGSLELELKDTVRPATVEKPLKLMRSMKMVSTSTPCCMWLRVSQKS
jgi:hypothetical protein